MKNLYLSAVMVFSSVVSSDACAEWVRIYGNEKMTAYADPSSIRSKGNIVRISSLFDFKTEAVLNDGNIYLSTVRETEFNCRENLQRMVGYSIYSGKMGKGKMLDSGSDAQEWKPVSKIKVAIDIKEYACDSA